jgi:ubiquitin C-terminal hydrolase
MVNNNMPNGMNNMQSMNNSMNNIQCMNNMNNSMNNIQCMNNMNNSMNNMQYMNNMNNSMNNMQSYGYFNNSFNNSYNNIQINQNNRVTLYDCFQYSQKTDYFTGDNQNYCKNCKKLSDTNFISKIYSCPNVLILILNRGKGNEFDVKLDFNEAIDIGQFVLLKDNPEINYDLYGVITHIGESGPNAHFIATCKSQINNQWYRFNDAFVNPIKNFKKDVFDFGIPYILFYQKV